MLLTLNSTSSFLQNETAPGQQSSTCIFVDSTAERISQICAYCVILLGSLFGNMFIIIIVYKNRDLRKTVNYFIVNMAVSDLLFPMFFLPVQITQLATDSRQWHVSGILGSIFCKLFYFASSVSLLVSAQSLVWIAIDRFVAVVFPMKLGLISTKIRTIAIISTWMFAGVFNFPWLLTWKLVERGNNTACEIIFTEPVLPNQEAFAAYIWLYTTLVSFAPLVFMTVLYSVITVALKRQNKALTYSAPSLQRLSLKKRRQAIQMAVVIVVMFYICVIPQTLKYIIYNLRPSCVLLKPSIYFIAGFALSSSSVVNPIICLLFVRSFRRGLRNMLRSCCRQRNSRELNASK